MKKFIIMGLVVAVLSGVWGQGNFFYLVALFAIVVYLVLPTLALMGLIALLDARRGVVRDWVKTTSAVAIIVIALSLLSAGVGEVCYHWQKQRMKQFVAEATPVLNDIKLRTGSYPSELPIDLKGKMPDWVTKGSYKADGNSFRFRCYDPAAFWDGVFLFDSKTSDWKQSAGPD
jgi:amino acid transporter